MEYWHWTPPSQPSQYTPINRTNYCATMDHFIQSRTLFATDSMANSYKTNNIDIIPPCGISVYKRTLTFHDTYGYITRLNVNAMETKKKRNGS
eukprot:scaffold23200_cov35-Prasinocladus_malaysianus.AAC.1